MGEARHTKVAKFQILKPASEGKWLELSRLLRDVQYRVYRLGNLVMSEKYIQALSGAGGAQAVPRETVAARSRSSTLLPRIGLSQRR